MPHFLIRGARQADAKDVQCVVFSSGEDAACEEVASHGILVAECRALDEDDGRRGDEGTPEALKRLATALNREGRVDDAIAVMHQVYAESNEGFCLRVPRYLLKAGRRDEAWEYLDKLRSGLIKGNGLNRRSSPHDVAEFFLMSEQVLSADERPDHAAMYAAAARISFSVHEWMLSSDGVANRRPSSRSEASQEIQEAFASLDIAGDVAKRWCRDNLPSGDRITPEDALRIVWSLDAALVELCHADSS